MFVPVVIAARQPQKITLRLHEKCHAMVLQQRINYRHFNYLSQT